MFSSLGLIKAERDRLIDNYQLKFDLPDREYINTKIPHFKHSGTGFHLLRAIGQAFNIDDYIFYQKQSATIYLGSYQDCYYADKQIELGDTLNKITLNTSGSDTITIPIVEKLRPGVLLNKRRIKIVNLINDELILTFDNNDKTLFAKQLEKNNPEILAGYHVPKFGRVVAISDSCRVGNISTTFRPRYAVDVQLLDANGNDDSTPVFKAVPLPVSIIGWEKGLYCYPDIGSIVDIGFAYGRADQPIVRNIYPVNIAVPAVQHGEILLQQRPEVYQRIDKIGNVTRATDQQLNDIAKDYYIKADYHDADFVERQTLVKADDRLNVLGNAAVNAGAISIVTAHDCGIGVGANYYQYVKQNYELTIDSNKPVQIKQNKNEVIGSTYDLQARTISTTASNDIQVTAKKITEKADTIYSIIAGSSAAITAPSIWLGSSTINVTQCMLDTLDLIKQLASLTAQHVHGDSSPPNNSASIAQVGYDASNTDNKYSSVISK